MQTFIEGVAVARKYQQQNQEMIKPNEHDKISFGCEDEESCVISQQTSDSFLSDSKWTVRTSLDYYTFCFSWYKLYFVISLTMWSFFKLLFNQDVVIFLFDFNFLFSFPSEAVYLAKSGLGYNFELN